MSRNQISGRLWVHLAAATLARSHPRAADYIEQAPVLVILAHNASVLLSKWPGPRRRKERDVVAGAFAGHISANPKLKDLLASYGASLPLRKLKPVVIMPSRVLVVRELLKIPSSTLSQIIPETSGGQLKWTAALHVWQEQIRRRTALNGKEYLGDKHFTWAASAISSWLNIGEAIAPDLVADYVVAHSDFSGKMTWRGAVAAADEWHDRLGRNLQESEFRKKYGIGVDVQMSYGWLPLVSEHDGYTFHALTTGRELHVEGKAMRHCVVDYTPSVSQGRSYIYSVRKDGIRIATLELTGSKSIAQLKGRRNTRVKGDVRAAANKFRGHALKRAIDAHVDELREHVGELTGRAP